MPSILNHQSSETAKVLLIGETGSGKTGALCSLAAEGYKVRVLDLDNGMDICKSYLTNPKSIYVQKNPKVGENFHYLTFTDPVKFISGQTFYSKAEAWAKAMESLMSWKEKAEDGSTIIDFGSVYSWEPDTVLVIDSLTALSQYALNYHMAMNGGLMKEPTQNEGRRNVGAVQNMLRRLLDMIKDTKLKCNVILTSHVTFVNEIGDAPKIDSKDGSREMGQGYPAAIGRALSPHIPRYFNTMLIAKTKGVGSGAKHVICTQSQLSGGQIINAKSSAPLSVKDEYPLESGLADYFKAVKGAK